MHSNPCGGFCACDFYPQVCGAVSALSKMHLPTTKCEQLMPHPFPRIMFYPAFLELGARLRAEQAVQCVDGARASETNK